MRRALAEALGLAYPAAAIGEAADGASALRLCRRYFPRLVLLDLGLPDANGIDLIAQIKAFVPHSSILVVSQHAESEYIDRALAAGACDYVPKDALRHNLLPAVAAALKG